MATRSTAKGKSASSESKSSSTANMAPDDTVDPSIVTEIAAVVSGPELRKKELIEEVATRTEVKRKFIKPVVEAVIEILGETIAEGREINIPPMGKLMHQRSKETANARITVAKIRQSRTAGSEAGKTEKESIAEDAD